MTENNIRLRFAPSPTGFLHIGNLRTALFGYLLAKSQSGKFILRIEDTDDKREVEGAIKSLVDISNWIGIEFDEGPDNGGEYGPYIQSERIDIYQKHIKQLLDEGKVYRCFCSSERLEEMRKDLEIKKLAPKYDRKCRDLSTEESNKRAQSGEAYVIRQKMPLEGEVKVIDELRGEIIFNAKDLDDQVLIKSNGIPTYQFANVVDDHLMKITHVTRGDEWIASFPKNVLLYQAFNWQCPKYIHLPLLLNKTGGKLSKRQGDVFVEDYRNKGYLKEAIVNFCALLGWHPKDDNEILSLEELKKSFSVSGLGISPAVFDIEKLDYYNAHYIRKADDSELIELSKPFLEKSGLPTSGQTLERAMSIAKQRLSKLSDAPDALSLFFIKATHDISLISWKNLSIEESKRNLREIFDYMKTIEDWDSKDELESKTISWIKENKEGRNGDYLWPLRTALSGQKNSPSPFEIAWAIGKDEADKRIEEVLLSK